MRNLVSLFRVISHLINPIMYYSNRRINKIRNIHKGAKAVIICNGPSLLKENLSELDEIYTIGLNKINLLFEKTDFRPNAIVAVNKLVIDQNVRFFNTTKIPLFLNSNSYLKIRFRKNIHYLFSTECIFSKDLSIEVSEGFTVTYVALQLCFYLGFKYVTLIGCDHDFGEILEPNKLEKKIGEDNYHFDRNYFGNGIKWHTPDIIESEISYMRAKAMYEKHEMKIFNSTIGGKLEIFERISLRNFLNI